VRGRRIQDKNGPPPASSARDIVSRKSLQGVVAAPPSKSVTQRALVVASLARGRSFLRRPLLGGDGTTLVNALRSAGLEIIEDPAAEVLGIDGAPGLPAGPAQALALGNAGTAMRFLTARLATEEREFVLDGDPRMRERPIEPLLRALRALGAHAAAQMGNGCPPVRVGGVRPPGGRAALDGAQSSQFLSGLLMAGPAFSGGVEVDIEASLVSRPYAGITIDVMRRFGVEVHTDAPLATARCFSVPADRSYRAADLTIEGDWSSASYFLAAAAIVPGRVQVTGVVQDSAQGDRRFAELLEGAGCRVERGPLAVTVTGSGTLRALDADLGDCPDIAPTAAVVALFADGTTRLRGLAHLRLKESDRIAALCSGVEALGGDARPEPDGVTIVPRRLHGGVVDPHGDHRMAMAFAIAGLRVPGVRILDPDCVVKSYPEFWRDFDALA
jgi:3-phosphoshikimate 1-carboxyvinyltransferase